MSALCCHWNCVLRITKDKKTDNLYPDYMYGGACNTCIILFISPIQILNTCYIKGSLVLANLLIIGIKV